jgi:hypothetical protein
VICIVFESTVVTPTIVFLKTVRATSSSKKPARESKLDKDIRSLADTNANGSKDGDGVGCFVGVADGVEVGLCVGAGEGFFEGAAEGAELGVCVGAGEGFFEGAADGAELGV